MAKSKGSKDMIQLQKFVKSIEDIVFITKALQKYRRAGSDIST
jgi:hypothetical protein